MNLRVKNHEKIINVNCYLPIQQATMLDAAGTGGDLCRDPASSCCFYISRRHGKYLSDCED